MSLQTPRILPAHLHAFHASSGPNSRTPRQVRVLGTISELRGETATITCGHHGEIMLRLNPDSHLQMGRMVEIIGKVVEVEPQVGSLLNPIGKQEGLPTFNLYPSFIDLQFADIWGI